MKDSIRTGESAQLLGVTPQTIRKYVKNNKIPYHTSPGGHLYFTQQDITNILGETPPTKTTTWAYYIRSSSGSKNIKQSQEKSLQLAYPQPKYTIQDNASGLNENRKGLKRLYALAEEGKITDIAITHKDRLTRFGYSYLEKYFKHLGITIHVLNQKQKNDNHNPASELIDDFMALLASFAGRYYRMRSKENQHKLLKQAQEKLDRKQEQK